MSAGRKAHDRAPWERVEAEIKACERCPRLVGYRREIARVKRRAFASEPYWGRPVPGFGDHGARIVLVGLAPAAHGANRTGRMFTGDRSGEWLYRALHRAGLASRPYSRARRDGLRLEGVFVTAACRCAPPANRPLPVELERCATFLDRELELLTSVRVVVALGAVAWIALHRRARRVAPQDCPAPRPRFAHGAKHRLPVGPGGRLLHVVSSYHPSQQNTSTGRLTEAMLDAVVEAAAVLAGPEPVVR